jgi:hypothetical protein
MISAKAPPLSRPRSLTLPAGSAMFPHFPNPTGYCLESSSSRARMISSTSAFGSG